MFSFLVLVASNAAVSAGPEQANTSCTEGFARSGEILLEAFANPDAKTRTEVRQRLEHLGASLRDETCKEALRVDLIAASLELQLDEVDAGTRLAEARTACTATGPSLQQDPADPLEMPEPVASRQCARRHLVRLVLGGDPAGRALVAEEKDEVFRNSLTRWLELLDRFPEKPKRFSVAWEGTDVDVRDWALQELLGPSDPRIWKPEDVALVVLQARAEDERALAAPKPLRRLHGGYVNPDTPSARLEALMKRLGRMGFLRAFKLVQQRTLKVPGINAPIPEGSSRSIAVWREHFPNELTFYSHEWRRAHPGVRFDWHDPIDEMQRLLPPASGTERELWVMVSGRNAEVRWLETDVRAPHPDVDLVQKAIRDLEKGKAPAP